MFFLSFEVDRLQPGLVKSDNEPTRVLSVYSIDCLKSIWSRLIGAIFFLFLVLESDRQGFKCNLSSAVVLRKK